MDRRKAIFTMGSTLFAELGLSQNTLANPSICKSGGYVQEPPRFAVMGVGGGGGNTVEAMLHGNADQRIKYVFANTDRQVLGRRVGGSRLQLGASGLGCGSNPYYGEKAALESASRICTTLAGIDVLIMVVAMGGGCGTGAVPVIARLAKARGIHCISIVITPFEFEGEHRLHNAAQGIQKLRGVADAVIVLPNELLMDALDEDTTQEEALRHSNDFSASVVHGFTDGEQQSEAGWVDLQKSQSVLSRSGVAVAAMGIGSGASRAKDAVNGALRLLALRGASVARASAVYAVISAPQGPLKSDETKTVMDTIRAHSGTAPGVYYSTRSENRVGGQLRVTLFSAGFPWSWPGQMFRPS